MENIILLIAYCLAQAHDGFRNSTAGRMFGVGTLDYAWERIEMFDLIMNIRNSRDARLPPRKRTHYKRHERMEILIIKERFRLSIAEASRLFQVSANTISNWMKSVPSARVREKR